MKKQELLNIAAKHFAKRGYEGISLDEIAKEAGITKPAIYYHFKNKDALYQEVLLQRLRGLVGTLQKEVAQWSDPRKRLQSYIEAFGAFLQKNSCFAAILAHEFADSGRHMGEDASKELSKTLGMLTSILNEGIKQDIFIIQNPMSVQMMIVSTLIMHQTTKPLRKKVTKFIDEYEVLPEPNIKDIAKILANNVLKAITKEE